MSPRIRVSVLGPLRVAAADGQELTSIAAQPRRAALLAYLALTQHRGGQPRDELLALFWPEYDEQRARNALNQAVHFLRRTLGPDAVIRRGDDQLLLDPELVRCDALDFESLLDAGETARALELHRGPVLQGFHVSDASPELERWLDVERDRLERRYALALERMAVGRDAAGDPAGAAVWWRKLAAHDPLASGAALGLMRALAAAGEPASALLHARIHEALVREELGAGPDPRITALVRELQQRSNGAGSTAVASNGVSVTVMPPSARVVALATMSNGHGQRDGDGESGGAGEADGDGDRGGDRGGETALGSAGSASRGGRFRRPRWLMASGALGAALVALALLVAARRGRTAEPTVGCVAVLPIENLSRDSSLEAVADALTDETITELARYERPRVISWTSVMQYRRARKPLPEIGRALDCDGAVEGGITRDGRVVRVHVQMFDAARERALWAESYDGDTSDLLGLEIRVAESVARHQASITALTAPPGAAARRTDPVVDGIYLRARDAFRSRNPASLREANALFRQVILLDSSFAAGYAGLSDTYVVEAGLGFGPPSLMDSGYALARRAVAVDSNSSEAHASMAGVYIDAHDWPRAEAEFQRAIRLEPGNALAHHWYAMLLRIEERKEEALREIRRASELDPLSDALMSVKAGIEAWAGVKSARGKGGPKDMVDPTHPGGLAWWAVVRARQHRCAEAYDLQHRADELAPDNSLMMIALVGVQLRCGNPAGARALLTKVERRPDAALMGLYIAQTFIAQGQRDSAFYWFGRTRWNLGTLRELRGSADVRPLRSDPRYAALIASLGLR